MSPKYFVTDPPVPIPEFGDDIVMLDDAGQASAPNVIWIRAKMDMAADARVKNELIKLGADNQTVEAHVGENQLALLIHNIVKWEGPDLSGVPCDAAHIKQLDPTEPHIQAVLQAIAERNKRQVSPNPKSATASIYASNGAAESNASASGSGADGAATEPNLSLQLATSTYTPHSRSVSRGRPKS